MYNYLLYIIHVHTRLSVIFTLVDYPDCDEITSEITLDYAEGSWSYSDCDACWKIVGNPTEVCIDMIVCFCECIFNHQ